MWREKRWCGCAQLRMLTPRVKLKFPTPWRARPIISRPAPSSQCAVSSEEHVQWVALGQDVAEDGVERLHDVRARRGGLGDLLRGGGAVRGDQPGGVGVEGVGDVDDDLAGECVPVLGDDRHGAGVRHGEDDDVAGRGGAECPGRGAAAERGGQVPGLGRVAAGDLDGVAALDRTGGYGAGHAPQADNADAAHWHACFLELKRKPFPPRRC